MTEYERLRTEHNVTLRVLALVVARLGGLIELTDDEVLHAPDMIALRDAQHGVIRLKVTP